MFTYHSEMKCPLTGKNCVKHKAFESEGKLVCEDCLQKSTPQVQPVTEMKCSSCGISLVDIVKGSRFGCPSCYDSFPDMIPHIIASVQSGDISGGHKGRTPPSFLEKKSKSVSHEEIREEILFRMNSASLKEDYAEAASLKLKLEIFDAIVKEGRADLAERLALLVLEFWQGLESAD